MNVYADNIFLVIVTHCSWISHYKYCLLQSAYTSLQSLVLCQIFTASCWALFLQKERETEEISMFFFFFFFEVFIVLTTSCSVDSVTCSILACTSALLALTSASFTYWKSTCWVFFFFFFFFFENSWVLPAMSPTPFVLPHLHVKVVLLLGATQLNTDGSSCASPFTLRSRTAPAGWLRGRRKWKLTFPYWNKSLDSTEPLAILCFSDSPHTYRKTYRFPSLIFGIVFKHW